ncbi:xanthine dehydrogenase accessory protein XdhC [uncultured Roseibium sp.]|uniref:xanthine dehydrogenase accessory protein XdhC n=1 Tax=uncultured Roseibium sp. TaxID=1936171 RepID=UPI0026086F1E|nr:xanthine dehydrogenase accessory protein XdhC [uncultured Roseibium sp.]
MKTWAQIASFLKEGDACALVTVSRVDGSAPREAGARMVVAPDMRFSGTIGGGTLEFETIRNAAMAARAGMAVFRQQNVSLGPDLGQCCGGRAQITIEVLTKESLGLSETLAAQEAELGMIATRAPLDDESVGNRRVSHQSPEYPFAIETDADGSQQLVEVFGQVRRPIVLFGAGHVGKALVLALAPLPFEVSWIDGRPDQFPGAVPANVRKIAMTDPANALENARDGAFVLAMTHSHALDEEIMARALLHQRFGYCGVIGSRTKKVRFQKRLKSRGIAPSLISHMVCPIGSTTIKSKAPATIAAGIAADLLERDEALHQQAAAGEGLAQNIPHGQ